MKTWDLFQQTPNQKEIEQRGRQSQPGKDSHSALAQMRQAVVQLKKFRIPATATLMSVLLGWRLRVVNLCSCSFRNSSGATLK